MAPVTAGVGERVEHPVLVAGQQDAARAERLGAHVARTGHLVTAAGIDPAAAKHVLLLPLEHRLIDVGGPGQHPAFPERPQGLRHGGRVKRGRGAHRLTDHTVKPKRRGGGVCQAVAAWHRRGPAVREGW